MVDKTEQIELTATVPESFKGQRLDQTLANLFPSYSRSRLQEWVKNKQVTVDNQLLRPRDKVHGGETIHIQAQIDVETNWQAQPIPLTIIFEDEALIIVDKPAGMVVHPAAGNPDNTLVNALLHHAPELEQLPRGGIIHRLDKDTSGLLVVPRTLEAHTHLVQQLQERRMKREYEAIATGVIIAGNTIDEPLGRHPIKRKQRAVIPSGKSAITHYRVIERFVQHTHIKVLLETGRTHQIRVHLAHIHHALLGDPVYGGRLRLPQESSLELKQALQQFKRQALHARRLCLTHPTTQEVMQWSSPQPDDMQTVIHLLRQHYEHHHNT